MVLANGCGLGSSLISTSGLVVVPDYGCCVGGKSSPQHKYVDFFETGIGPPPKISNPLIMWPTSCVNYLSVRFETVYGTGL